MLVDRFSTLHGALLLRTANLLDSAVYANFGERRLGELRRKTLPRLYEKWFSEGISLL
jgi:hypothetical protein